MPKDKSQKEIKPEKQSWKIQIRYMILKNERHYLLKESGTSV